MSRPDLIRFTEDFQNDLSLAAAFDNLSGDATAWCQLAAEKGYELTLDEAEGLISSYGELSDDDLENVAGGWDGG